MSSLRSELIELARQRQRLLAESLPLGVSAVALLGLTPGVERAGADARFFYVLIFVFFCSRVVRFTEQVLRLLHAECPRCTRSFFGLPEAIPRPLRRQCAHCGGSLEVEDVPSA